MIPESRNQETAVQIDEDYFPASAMILHMYLCFSPYLSRYSGFTPNHDGEGGLKKWWNAFVRYWTYVEPWHAHFAAAFHSRELDKVYVFELGTHGRDNIIYPKFHCYSSEKFFKEMKYSERDLVAIIPFSPERLVRIAKESQLNGEPYSPFRRNCQVWLKRFLNKVVLMSREATGEEEFENLNQKLENFFEHIYLSLVAHVIFLPVDFVLIYFDSFEYYSLFDFLFMLAIYLYYVPHLIWNSRMKLLGSVPDFKKIIFSQLLMPFFFLAFGISFRAVFPRKLIEINW